MSATPVPIPAATLILVREGNGALPELLMIERAAVMAFAPGASVFPGGRIDGGDRIVAGAATDIDEAAARIAAIRETLEETGIAVALRPPPDARTAKSLRARLASGETFGALLADTAFRLDPDALIAFSRWLPDLPETRVFDTRFYIARAPADADPSPDGSETIAARWITAAGALAAADRGDARLIFPTRRNLERLAPLASFAEIAADAARWPVETITPWTEQRGGEQWLCIPEGLGYPLTAQRLSEVGRG